MICKLYFLIIIINKKENHLNKINMSSIASSKSGLSHNHHHQHANHAMDPTDPDNGLNQEEDNPFRIPPDEKIFSFKEEEKERKTEEREQNK